METERLELIPLSAEELRLWLDNLPALEKRKSCHYRAEEMTEEFAGILRSCAAAIETDPENLLWHTFWWIVRREDRAVVGSIDFKNVPSDGVVEIGYGLGPAFEHRGYMTESVKAFLNFARARGVRRVVAETETNNLPSQLVLQRCGFCLQSRGDTLRWGVDL